MTHSDKYKPIAWTEQLVGRYWDYWQQFPETYFTYDYGMALVDMFSKYLKNQDLILDYGAGRGFLTQALLSKKFNVTAVDFSPASVYSLASAFSQIPCFGGAYNLEDLLMQEKQFSVIMLIEVIEHLGDEDLKKTFSIIRKLLKPNGLLIISTPNSEDLKERTIYCPCCNHTFHRWQHVQSWDCSSLAACLQSEGFKITKSWQITLKKRMRFRERMIQEIKRNFYRTLGKHRKQPHLLALATPL
ncbi:MAG: class I SAM-dependent methyltransferase [Magnetococcales bacterium]|nr:class I SAM-dependent methyltransferase [Magnetococcales bacterium]